MNHKEYTKILNDRIASETKEERESDTVEIRIVYTPKSLVRAGQEFLRKRKQEQAAPAAQTVSVNS